MANIDEVLLKPHQWQWKQWVGGKNVIANNTQFIKIKYDITNKIIIIVKNVK